MRAYLLKRKHSSSENDDTEQTPKKTVSRCIDMKALLNSNPSPQNTDHGTTGACISTERTDDVQQNAGLKRVKLENQLHTDSEMTATTCSTTTAIIDPDICRTQTLKHRASGNDAYANHVHHAQQHQHQQHQQHQRQSDESPVPFIINQSVANNPNMYPPSSLLPKKKRCKRTYLRTPALLSAAAAANNNTTATATTTTTATLGASSPVFWELRYESGLIHNKELGPVPLATRRLVGHSRSFQKLLDKGYNYIGNELNLTWDQMRQTGCMLRQHGKEALGYWEISCVPGHGDRFYCRIYAIRLAMPAAWIVESVGFDTDDDCSQPKIIAVCDNRQDAVDRARAFVCSSVLHPGDTQGDDEHTWDNLMFDGVVSCHEQGQQNDGGSNDDACNDTDGEVVLEWDGGCVVVRYVKFGGDDFKI